MIWTTPRYTTMAKIAGEDENPRIEAEIFVHFQHETEARWVPITPQPAELNTSPEGLQVQWPFYGWIPEQDTEVYAIKVHFPDYDDEAVRPFRASIPAHHELAGRYRLIVTTS